MPELLGLYYSPWTERCRWAIDHHGISYRYTSHEPLLGEMNLRLRLRKLRGRVTVPVLFDGHTVLSESWDIARWADRNGSAETLFPNEHVSAIRHWDDRSQAACALGRELAVRKTLGSKAALRAQLETVPAPLRPVMLPAAPLVVKIFGKKHASATPRDENKLREALVKLRAALDGNPTIFDTLTYADLSMATMLQFVEPVDEQYIRLDPRVRPTWADPALAREFADLVEWRDALYANHRRR